MKFGWVFLLCLLVASCGNKKNSESADTVMDVKDFYQLFKPIKLPYTIGDTSFNKISKDSSMIKPELLALFVGDSILQMNFGTDKTRLYPAGRVSVKKAETYLFVKAVNGTKKMASLLVFDKDDKFRASLPLVVTDNDPLTSETAIMDGRYTISVNKQRKKPNGDLGYKKDAYVYNNIGVFTLILTESNEDLPASAEIVNPLDTLPKKNKLSGDYVQDKRNLISVRDGKRNAELRFFVHFEKDRGACKGELRGDATITKPNVAVFKESGDPCVLEFTFGANTVSMREVEGCGNYRDIKCFFEGTYARKKEKPKAARKK